MISLPECEGTLIKFRAYDHALGGQQTQVPGVTIKTAKHSEVWGMWRGGCVALLILIGSFSVVWSRCLSVSVCLSVHATILRKKLQIKLSISLSHGILTLGQPLRTMPLWRGGPNTRTLPTVLLTPSASKAADTAHLCVPQNQALGVCRGFAPDIQICGTHGRKNLVNATIISNVEEEEEELGQPVPALIYNARRLTG